MRAATSRRYPRAHAICDRCGFEFNHDELQWQFQWAGPRLQNLRILVCRTCLDVPQEQLRTIVLPPDPVPIQNPRPEDYVSANNPNSPIGQSASPELSGTNIGNLIHGGGTYAAFDGNADKIFALSANLPVSIVGYNNWVGKKWSDDPSLTYGVQRFVATAPTNMGFSTANVTLNYKFQGSSDGVTWTDLASGTTNGEIWESIDVAVGSLALYQYHRLAFNGDGVNPIGISQLAIYTTNRGGTTSIL